MKRITNEKHRLSVLDLKKYPRLKYGVKLWLRLAEIENIISDENDEYDLDRIKVIFEQKISLRKEAAERFKITKNIPIERLREIVKEYKDGQKNS